MYKGSGCHYTVILHTPQRQKLSFGFVPCTPWTKQISLLYCAHSLLTRHKTWEIKVSGKKHRRGQAARKRHILKAVKKVKTETILLQDSQHHYQVSEKRGASRLDHLKVDIGRKNLSLSLILLRYAIRT